MTNFKGLHTVTIKILQSAKLDSIPTANRAVDALIKMIDSGDLQQLTVHPQFSLETLSNLIKEQYGDAVTIRDGVSDGCYGSTNGETYSGLTVYIDAIELPERWSTDDDGEYTEFFNPLVTMENAGFKLVSTDEDTTNKLFDALEDNGNKIKHDNSYNWSGESETVVPVYDFDFKIIEKDNLFLIGIMFHNGGDPRGNYGSRMLFTCRGNEEFYEGLAPCFLGKA